MSAYDRVQEFFFDFPGREVSLNELCSSVKVSKTAARQAVLRLVSEGFLKKQVTGRLWRLSVVPSHRYNFSRKAPYHLRLIYESGAVDAVRKKFPGARAIVLFGSYRKGDDTERSDLDIAVELAAGNLRIV